jgi:TrmH family RNA methyltransferase
MQEVTTSSPLYATALKGTSLYEELLPESCCFVFGNEAKGLTQEAIALCDGIITIPPFGASGAESLNVAVATAVVCSETRRQGLIQNESRG